MYTYVCMYNILFTDGEDFEPVILNVTLRLEKPVNIMIIPDNIVEEDERSFLQMIGFEDQPNSN